MTERDIKLDSHPRAELFQDIPEVMIQALQTCIKVWGAHYLPEQLFPPGLAHVSILLLLSQGKSQSWSFKDTQSMGPRSHTEKLERKKEPRVLSCSVSFLVLVLLSVLGQVSDELKRILYEAHLGFCVEGAREPC